MTDFNHAIGDVMGFRDRDYYRDDSQRGRLWGIDGLTPGVQWLILANVAVFLLQIFWTVPMSAEEIRRQFGDDAALVGEADGPDPAADPEGDPKAEKTPEKKAAEGFAKKHRDQIERAREAALAMFRESVVQKWFSLDTAKVLQGQVWRLVTHAFCHERMSIFHILINMLLLFWFGCTMEKILGTTEFLLFYFAAILAAAAAFVGLDLYTGSRIPAIGASGAVMAVMMLYTWYYPTSIIRIFWFFPVEMRWAMALYALWDLHPVLLALSGAGYSTGIAHAAHLGGLVFGLLYGKFEWRLEPYFDRIFSRRTPSRLAVSSRSRPRLRIAPETVPPPNAENERVDHLLQKILESGRSSLTDEEREFLLKASERIKRSRE